MDKRLFSWKESLRLEIHDCGEFNVCYALNKINMNEEAAYSRNILWCEIWVVHEHKVLSHVFILLIYHNITLSFSDSPGAQALVKAGQRCMNEHSVH